MMTNQIETTGKIEDEKFEPTLLEQVWGADSLSRYGTLELSEYTKRLDEMTRSDMEAHARQMGVVIVEHSPRLREKLISAFASYVSLVHKPASQQHPTSTKLSDAAKKILSEGR